MIVRGSFNRTFSARYRTTLVLVGVVGLLLGSLGVSAHPIGSGPPTRIVPAIGPVPAGGPSPPVVGGSTHPMTAPVPVVWSRLSNFTTTAPTARSYPAFAVDPADGVDVLFGGYLQNSSTNAPTNETWTLANGVWQKESPATSPPPLGGASMAYDPDLGSVVLVGATAKASERTSDAQTWEYRAGSWTQLATSLVGSPPATLSASMAYDPILHALVRFGGYGHLTNGNTWTSNETWLFANDSWTNATGSTEPRGVFGSAMAYDPTTQSIVLVGGVPDEQAYYETGSNVTWAWSNGSWRNLDIAAGPDPNVAASLVWDPSIGGSVLTGGGTSWYLGSLIGYPPSSWVYERGTWSELDLSGDSPTTPVSVTAPDPTLGGLVSLGHWSYPGYAIPAWELTRAPAVAVAAAHDEVDVGVPDVFSNLLANASLATSLAWTFGDGTTDAVGAAPSHTYSSPGTYDVNATATATVGGQSAFDWANRSVSVVPDPRAALAPIPSTVDVFENTSFSAGVANGTAPFRVSWAFGDGATESGNWTVVHRYAAAGTYLANAEVTDAFGITSNRTVAVHVEPFPLVTVALSGAVVDLGQPVTIHTATWNGSAPFTFGYSGLPPGCAASNVANLTCTPVDTGQYEVEVTVVDAHGVHSTSGLELLTVAPPLVGALRGSAAVIDLGMSLTVAATFASQGSGNVSVRLPDGSPCEFLGPFLATCQPSSPGEFVLTATASDRAGSLEALGPVVVTVNRPVSAAAVGPPTAIDRDTLFALAINESGGTPPFAYSYGAVPPGCVHVNATTFRCDPQLPGSYSFGATVTDALGATATTHLVVTVVDGPPGTISGPPPPSHPPPPATNLLLWAVVAAAVVQIVLSVRYARRPRGRHRRPSTFRKGLWSVLGSAASDDVDAGENLALDPDAVP